MPQIKHVSEDVIKIPGGYPLYVSTSEYPGAAQRRLDIRHYYPDPIAKVYKPTWRGVNLPLFQAAEFANVLADIISTEIEQAAGSHRVRQLTKRTKEPIFISAWSCGPAFGRAAQMELGISHRREFLMSSDGYLTTHKQVILPLDRAPELLEMVCHLSNIQIPTCRPFYSVPAFVNVFDEFEKQHPHREAQAAVQARLRGSVSNGSSK